MKKGRNSKKVGTDSGNITNIDTEAAMVTEEKYDEQENLAPAIGTTETGRESFEVENENDTSDIEHKHENGEEDSEAIEEWELKKIMSIEAINHQFPVKCSHDSCTLVAATVWISNQKPDEKWYSCLDCQVS